MPKQKAPEHAVLLQVAAKLQEASALHRQRRFAQARVLFEKILKVVPAHFDALNSLGMIAGQTGSPQQAVVWFDKAIAADPGKIYAYVNKGVALHASMNLEAALESFDEAIARQYDYAEAHFNRGNVLWELGQIDAALASYDVAISINSEYSEAYCNRGVILTQLEQFDLAVANLDRAISLRPDYAKAYFNRAFIRLARGDFGRGLVDYEWRRRLDHGPGSAGIARFSQPLWLGEQPLAGKTILLQGEQGFGDTLQFCRYAQLVADQGARVILEVQRPLMRLLSTLGGVSQLVGKGDSVPPFDCHCPLMSLPLAFKTDVGTIPQWEKYLRSDPVKLAQWRSMLGEKRRPRVGLVWSGSATNKNDRNRSFPLADLLPHLPQGFDYFRLQKEAREADEKTLRANPHVLDFSRALKDFSDTAALCDCMDLVISTCTSVAHLSGALGRKTWILLGNPADWRWLLDRNDSPWYPSARLYRRLRADGWTPVFERVAADLAGTLR